MHTKSQPSHQRRSLALWSCAANQGGSMATIDPHRQVIEVKRGDVKETLPCRLSAEARA